MFLCHSTRDPLKHTGNTIMKPQQSKAKQASIIAITTALYALFFAASFAALPFMPNFALLYLPIILLGVFPIWFGWNGLAGAMIGGFIGGAFSEGLGALGIFESVVALLIYIMNWVLIPKKAAEDGNKKRIVVLLGLYTVSLLVGTAYIVWQYTVFPAIFPAESWLTITLTTFALNLPIVLIACPALIKAISPKIRIWGIYIGNFSEWRSRRAKPKLA
jgi:hypothetical protein